MPRDYYPRRESEILIFTANLSSRFSEDPEAYSLTPEQAAQYAFLQQEFADAYAASNSGGSDTTSSFARKESARIALEQFTRPIVRVIRGSPSITDAMLCDLGLSPRTQRRRRVPQPERAPVLIVREVMGTTVHLRILDAESGRRSKPRDVTTAAIFAFVGEDPPADGEQWMYKGQTTQTLTEVRFDPTLPLGTRLWLSARWQNHRCEPGPLCAPVGTSVHSNAYDLLRPTRLAA